MKEKYHIFYNSNIFARDLQYAIKQYFEKKDMKIKYPQAEELMQQFSKYLEEKGDLRRLTNNSWRVNFFKPEPVEEDKSTVTDAKE
jgi:rRNA maturation endonuclease Nob1